MENIFLMRLFRCFVLLMIFILYWFYCDLIIFKISLFLMIMFLLIYYWKEIVVMVSRKQIFFGLTIFMALISAFLIFKFHQVKIEQNNDDNKIDLKILVLRNSVLYGDHNVTLGKIINDDRFGNKYIFIRSGILEKYSINQILFVNANLQKYNQKSLPFDLLFFGKVFYQIGFEEIKIVGKHSEFNIFEKIVILRNKIDEKIKIIFDLENYNLISMWLLGKTNVVDNELNQTFRKIGINHILIVSGTHLSIFFNLVLYLLFFLPLGLGFFNFILSFVILVMFVLLTGFSASIFRAALMWLLILIARYKGGLINYTNIFLVVLMILAIINPLTLVYDVGFHLSFLSVVSLFYILPIFIFYYKKLKISLAPWVETFIFVFIASMSISFGLVAYILYVFKEFNFLSAFFNVFLIPLAAIALGLVFLATISSFLSLFLGKVLGFAGIIIIKIFLYLTDIFAKINTQGNILMFNAPLAVSIYYLGLFVLVVDFYKKNPKLTFNI